MSAKQQTFTLESAPKTKYTYYLVWITKLPTEFAVGGSLNELLLYS